MLVTIWHPLVYLLQKNVLTTSKPPVDLSPAEVRYHRILKLRPNLSRLRSQSARVGGALGRPTSHPDDLFLDFTPKATRIERAAGRVPGSIPSSTAAQVLRMTRKQNEYFRRAPPMRTPPSIPSPHCQLFGRGSPRVDTLFNPELEHHARKEVRPLKYIQHGNGHFFHFITRISIIFSVIMSGLR